jgi:RHS repeat-associated protein
VQYTYEPFGGTAPSGTAASNSFQYTGRENDGIGIFYYRARYYNPVLGRFISEDPIGFLGGMNFYSYVGNDPINFSDPMGLCKDHQFDNCYKVLKKVFPGFDRHRFDRFSEATPIFFPRDPGFLQLTVADVVGGTDTTKLNKSLPFGTDAVTLHGGPYGAAILLGPEAFTNPAGIDAILFHEHMHGFTNWDDQTFFQKFKPFGLDHNNPGTNDITLWITTNCRFTPKRSF